jgi:hypothetical protein
VRKALNDNPMVLVGVLGVLALIVGFLLITRMSHKSSSSSSTTPTTAASTASGTEATPTSTTPSTAAPSATSDATATTPDAATGTATPPAPATGAVADAAAAGQFVAGPGLPAPVVKAYAENKVIVLLVVRHEGIDDDAVKASVEQQGSADVALFVTNAGHIARYSRIAEGVNVDRVPALIVLQPRNLTHGAPVATVDYGFRGTDSVSQAIQDALYKGPTNLPTYPK